MKRIEKKHSVLVLGFIFLWAFIWPSILLAAVPQEINYQGYLTDANGTPLGGTYDMRFHIYNDPTDGNELWNEEQSVLITDGVYDVSLGSVVPLSEGIFSATYVGLEVEIYNPDSAVWETLTPRQHLTSTAYAMRAAVAETVADGVVNTVHIMDNAVTGAKIDNGTVETADLQDGTVLAEIADDDGSGSGLDADNLDGHDTAYFATASAVTALQGTVAALQAQVNQLVNLLANVTRDGNDITFSNVNVHIVNGTGTTDGTVNGRGNLIVGYNEERGTGDNRTGSHNIIVGMNNNYSSCGGLVAGRYNAISGILSSVSGGSYNEASEIYSSVSGGTGNDASGQGSSVSGGYSNEASEIYSSVNGGVYNTASGPYSSVSGGSRNEASEIYSSVSGGSLNTASGEFSHVSGGLQNTASGKYSFVGGGGHLNPDYSNEAFSSFSAILGGSFNITGDKASNDHNIGEFSTISGGYGNTASGDNASISGGGYNTASGYNASISGGRTNKASGDYSFVGGGGHPNPAYGNEAFSNLSAILGGSFNITGDKDSTFHYIGELSTISGGDANRAKGGWSSISGGQDNHASGTFTSISGGLANTTDSSHTTVSGGAYNTADSSYATVSGGHYNTASGASSTVSGGYNNTASNAFDSVLGDYGGVYVDTTLVY